MINKIVAKLKDRLNITVLVQAILAIVTPVGCILRNYGR